MSITPEREAALLEAIPSGLFIGGAWAGGTGGPTLHVQGPACGAGVMTGAVKS